MIFRYKEEHEEIFVNTSRRKVIKTGRTNPPIPHDIDFVRGSVYGYNIYI